VCEQEKGLDVYLAIGGTFLFWLTALPILHLALKGTTTTTTTTTTTAAAATTTAAAAATAKI